MNWLAAYGVTPQAKLILCKFTKSFAEALKVMTTLTSKNAPLVKKRALMRSTFGDYRKKMALERNSHEKGKLISILKK